MTLSNLISRDALIMRIDAILPQTQCGQCGYPGCKPYATAIADGAADINQCPPGGDAGAIALSELLGVEYKPLNIEYGTYKPKSLASIDENLCIGCTLCLQACPVDAILGAARQMHTVIAAECTGCELCMAPCPVDCISMQAITPASSSENKAAADIARARHEVRNLRIAHDKQERAQRRAQKMAAAKAAASQGQMSPAEAAKKAAIAAAMERARMQKAKLQLLDTDKRLPGLQKDSPDS